MLHNPDNPGIPNTAGNYYPLFSSNQNSSSGYLDSNDIPRDPYRQHHHTRHSGEDRHNKYDTLETFFNSELQSLLPSNTTTGFPLSQTDSDLYSRLPDSNLTDLPYNVSGDPFCRPNISYLNITCELPIDYAQPMYGYIAPFLLATTTVANTLIVVVLSRRHMRTPTNAVLMAMALCDMFTLLFPAPWLFYMYTFGNHYKPLYPVEACYAWNVMNEVSSFL